MGFPFGYIKLPKLFSTNDFLHLLTHIRFLLVLSISRLGLLNPPEQPPPRIQEQNPNYILVLTDELCPSPIPVPVHVLTAQIKKRLPIVKYGSLIQRRLIQEEGNSKDESKCLICLGCVEEEDDIRELCNCCHVFHHECLDSWVDSEQVTCPSCRSMLLPRSTGHRPLPWMHELRN